MGRCMLSSRYLGKYGCAIPGLDVEERLRAITDSKNEQVKDHAIDPRSTPIVY